MSGHVVAFLIVAGAAVIGVWIHVRFPRLAPEEFRRSFLHMAVSTLLAGVLIPPGMALAREAGPAAGALLGVFGVAFPILVYCLLASFWVLRVAAGMLPTR